MKSILSFLLFTLAAVSPGYASDFRYCDMVGTIEAIEPKAKNKVPKVALAVRVTAAHREAGPNGKDSYTDCSEFVGETLQLLKRMPKRLGKPVAGNELKFNYSSADYVDATGGYAGTAIKIEYLALTPSK